MGKPIYNKKILASAQNQILVSSSKLSTEVPSFSSDVIVDNIHYLQIVLTLTFNIHWYVVLFCELYALCLQLGEHAHYLTSLMKDMNVEYTESGNKGFVYTPYIGKLLSL